MQKNKELIQNNTSDVSKYSDQMQMKETMNMLTQMVQEGKFEHVDKIFEIQEKLDKRQSIKVFNESMAKAQSEMPLIYNDKEVHDKYGNLLYKFPSYALVQKTIKPIYTSHGFSVSFMDDSNGVKAVVEHSLGHKKEYFLKVEEMSATKTTNKIQQTGSRMSYARRYLQGMIWNLVFEDEDDDGQSSGFKLANESIIEEIKVLAKEVGSETSQIAKHFNVTDIDQLYQHQAERTLSLLKAKKKQKKGNE